jgi:hypothetical protein
MRPPESRDFIVGVHLSFIFLLLLLDSCLCA